MHFNLKRTFGNEFIANGVFITRVMHVNCGIMKMEEGLPRINTDFSGIKMEMQFWCWTLGGARRQGGKWKLVDSNSHEK